MVLFASPHTAHLLNLVWVSVDLDLTREFSPPSAIVSTRSGARGFSLFLVIRSVGHYDELFDLGLLCFPAVLRIVFRPFTYFCIEIRDSQSIKQEVVSFQSLTCSSMQL